MMGKITKKVLDRIEKELRADKRQSVVGFGCYIINRIRSEIEKEEGL